ncbi:hypothetical protein BN59_00227 [Legionella massiliensis]|uniref:Dot/Icm secretion system substrate n=1 Tax=Legionella massiliensis TaxID=1034943 RepID=A0A078KNQ9_9GAMM|nr:hypothetical protein [Legionella massiliensis]CDZ75965.1 hypothetical protein BN59_00227 [Legionella massiliensis]CEE11703.1 hypothetical protein BN1094_00227 [Legionella massiliensis]
MPAFTRLCEKVNISLFDDTITLYPKKTGKTSFHHVHPIFQILMGAPAMIELECEYEEAGLVTQRVNELNEPVTFVHRDDADHDRYHQDSFPLDDTHMHMRFAKAIDEPKLEQVLEFFAKHNLISGAEQASFLQDYRMVKQQNAQLDQLASGKASVQLVSSQPAIRSTVVSNPVPTISAVDSEDDSENELDEEVSSESIDNLLLIGSRANPLLGGSGQAGKAANKPPVIPANAIKTLFSFNPKQQAFIEQLKIMNEKALVLADKATFNEDYDEANKKARALCDSLYFAYIAFNSNPKSYGSCRAFDKTCNTAFGKAESTLKDHREYGEVWANIALAFVLLGVGYVVYGLYNKYHNNDSFMFFKTNTDSGKKMDNLKTAAQEMITDPSACASISVY